MFAESLISLIGLISLARPGHAAPTLPLYPLTVAKYVSGASLPPVKKNPDSLGVEVTARAATVLDVGSGKILFEKDSVTPHPIASLSKLVTAMAFLDTKPNLDDLVTLTADDESHDRSPFAPGEHFTKRDLLQALLVGSVNTAGYALARMTADQDTFIGLMNKKAQALRMQNAVFYDPTGLDPRNQASAHDVALALQAALSYPEIRETTEHPSVTLKGLATGQSYTVKTTDLLLTSFLNKAPYHIVAGKTGSLPEAGFCLATATRDQDGNEIISVVLGSTNHFARFQDAKALTAWAFMNYEWPKRQANNR